MYLNSWKDTAAERQSGKLCAAMYSLDGRTSDGRLVYRDDDGIELEIIDTKHGEAILELMRRNFQRGYVQSQREMRRQLGL